MPAKKSKLPPNANKKEQLHYNAVLLEEIRSQMNAVIETVDLTRTELNEKIDGVEKRLTDRIEIVEVVVKKNSEDIQSLRADVKEIKQKFDGVAEKVERHDEEIALLKSSAPQT